jgi:long-subunit acyl-CoA synthetase (AMP-forming)
MAPPPILLREFHDRLRLGFGCVPGAVRLNSCGAAATIPVLVLEDLSKELGQHSAKPTANITTREDVLQIVFTSGTTAEPKGVVITHGNVLANIDPLEQEMQRYLKYERWVHPVRFLNLLPLSHVFGQFSGCSCRRCWAGQ